MNLLCQKREQVIREKNTAQTELEGMLENISPTVVELNITKPLSGDLDLEVLNERGYTKLKSIRFEPNDGAQQQGEITSVKVMTPELKYFSCVRQLLADMNLWMPQVEELHLEHNCLSSLDLTTCMRLKRLYVGHNQITELKHIPRSIEEIYASHNRIKTLDLKELPNLRVLHCAGNPNIVVANIPRTTLDLVMDETDAEKRYVEEEADDNDEPSVRVGEDARDGSAAMERRYEYKEAVREYFKLKTKYEKKARERRTAAYEQGKTLKEKRRRAREVVPECVKCRRRVGTIFEQTQEQYVAICGSKTAPCGLKIELFRGGYDNLEWLIDLHEETIEKMKTEMMCLMLDTLFHYISEEKSVKMFTQKLGDYNSDGGFYKKLVEKYRDLHDNEYKHELRKQKIDKIYKLKYAMGELRNEYAQTGNREVLHAIMRIYKEEYMPEVLNLRQLDHEVMEMVSVDNRFKLFQRDTKMSSLDYLFGKPPAVKTFQV
jgi:hypothetical protein